MPPPKKILIILLILSKTTLPNSLRTLRLCVNPNRRAQPRGWFLDL